MPILGREASQFGDFLNQDEGEIEFSDPERAKERWLGGGAPSLSALGLGTERLSDGSREAKKESSLTPAQGRQCSQGNFTGTECPTSRGRQLDT